MEECLKYASGISKPETVFKAVCKKEKIKLLKVSLFTALTKQDVKKIVEALDAQDWNSAANLCTTPEDHACRPSLGLPKVNTSFILLRE